MRNTNRWYKRRMGGAAVLALVTGGSASGKSEYAENLLCELWQGNKLYIAAMQPYGPNDAEFKARVERHRALRAGKGFRTAERYTDLAGLPLDVCGGVLLECLSNLCANEFFREAPEESVENGTEVGEAAALKAVEYRVYNAVLRGIEHLCKGGGPVVVVTNEIFSDGCGYEEPTLSYIRLLGKLNTALTARADCVVEVVCGIPVVHKKEGEWPL